MGVDRTPLYGIETPDGDYEMFKLPTALKRLGETIEAALVAAGIIANTPEWQPFNAAVQGVNLGAGGTVTAGFTRAGKVISLRLAIVLGTGGSVTGDVSFSLPRKLQPHALGGANATPAAQAGATLMRSIEGASGRRLGVTIFGSLTSVIIRALNPATLQHQQLTATAPFAWASGDAITVELTYVTSE